MIRSKDGYGKHYGTAAGSANHALISDGSILEKNINSVANTLVLRNAQGLIVSTLAAGKAPFVVASTDLVANLNANYLDGITKTELLNKFNDYLSTSGGELTGNLKVNGYVNITDNYKIGGLDVVRVRTDHLALGEETTVYSSLPTKIHGKYITMQYGETKTGGFFLNSSGNVTIGSSDLASSTYKLYVNGKSYLVGNSTVVGVFDCTGGSRFKGDMYFTSVGNGTYNLGMIRASTTQFVIEAPWTLNNTSSDSKMIPFELTWRGGYPATGGLRLTGGSDGYLGGKKIYHEGNLDVSKLIVNNGGGVFITGTTIKMAPENAYNNAYLYILKNTSNSADYGTIIRDYRTKNGTTTHTGFTINANGIYYDDNGTDRVIYHAGNLDTNKFFLYRNQVVNNTDFNTLNLNGIYFNTTGNGTGNSNLFGGYGYLLRFYTERSDYGGVLIGVNANSSYVAFRSHWDHKWKDWVQLASTSYVSSNYLPLTGGTLTNGLNFKLGTLTGLIYARYNGTDYSNVLWHKHGNSSGVGSTIIFGSPHWENVILETKAGITGAYRQTSGVKYKIWDEGNLDLGLYYKLLGLMGTSSGTWDWDSYSTIGTYKVQTGSSITNHPKYNGTNNAYQYGLAMIIRGMASDGEGRISQIYFPHNATGNIPIYTRMRNSNTWTAWCGIPSTTYVDNKCANYMPKSGGTFTGSIQAPAYVLNGGICYLDIDASKNLIYYDGTSRRIVYNSGNFTPSDYLLKSGGTINGGLKLNYLHVNTGVSGSCGLYPNSSISLGGESTTLWLYTKKKLSIYGESIEFHTLPTINGNNILHAGNCSSYASGSSSKLDSANLKSTKGLHYYYAGGITQSTDNTGEYSGPLAGTKYSSILRLQSHDTAGGLYYRDLIFDVNSDYIWSRRITNSGTPVTKTLAFTTDNVASATKLETSRTIWGRAFDGSANISGQIEVSYNRFMSIDLKTQVGYAGRVDVNDVIYLHSANNLSFGSGGLNGRMYIKSDGNVGINTTSPTRRFQVNGIISCKSSSYSHEYYINPHGNGFDIASTGNLAPHYITNFAVYKGAPNSGEIVLYANSDKNVGIGTQSPTTKLEVNGTVKATAFSGNASSASTASKIGDYSPLRGNLYYTYKEVTMSTVNTAWYLKIELSGYSKPNYFIVEGSYNNEIDHAIIEFAGFSMGYIYRNNNQNGGNIKGVWFEAVYNSNGKWVFWIKMDPIYNSSSLHYLPSSSATYKVYLGEHWAGFTVTATTTAPSGADWTSTSGGLVFKGGNCDKIDGYHLSVGTSAGTDTSTIYFVT